MTPENAITLSERLRGSATEGELGRTLAAALLDGMHADAVLAWLPHKPDVPPQLPDVFLAGQLLSSADHTDLVAALASDQLPAHLAKHGAALVVAVQRPPIVGRLVVAWRDAPAVETNAKTILELVASQVTTLVERRQSAESAAAMTAALRDVEDQILRAGRARTAAEMASGLVHDFNNYLTTILGYTELVLAPLSEADSTYAELTTIRTAAMDAAALARRLQAVGKRAYAAEREIVSLAEVARTTVELARPRGRQRAEVDGVSFEFILDTQPVPPVYVVLSEIREILLNLLFNAIDAMPTGGRIVITTGMADGLVQIAVRDDGMGMSHEVQERLFQPFFTTKGDRGCGLGLSVSRSIAERHSGSLTAHSAPGLGSILTLSIPPAPAELVKTVRGGSAATYTCSRPVKAPYALRVLVVDDQRDVRDSVGEMLGVLGHSVVTASDGAAALALIVRETFDVVLTDVGMPEMNGVQLVRRLQSIAPGVPAVLMSGWGIDPDMATPANVACVLSKPLTMTTLSDAITACAGHASGAVVKEQLPTADHRLLASGE
jgi:signal transduction histidine kinase/ActR/RegA family two-component response regulator